MAEAEIHFGLKPISIIILFLRPKGRSYSEGKILKFMIPSRRSCPTNGLIRNTTSKKGSWDTNELIGK
jgi:hypothetical protein